MLEQILRELKNYFIREVWVGDFKISSGTIDVDFLKENQYFKIAGSIFNDGVYKYPVSDLQDEEFTGEIWAMAVPPAVIALSEEVEQWCTDNAELLKSPYMSESFGGYSYSRGSGSGASGATVPAGWKDMFASRMNEWKKVRYEFVIKRNDYVQDS